jgi:hypothetical protein
MKGTINKEGRLLIKRNNKLIEQSCPYTTDPDNHCSHWCPLFEEDGAKGRQIVWLHCSSQAYCISITKDERK